MKPMLSIRSFSILALSICGALATLAQSTTIPPATTSHVAKVSASYGKVRLQFEANQGQADVSTKFLSRGPGYLILLQPDAATFVLHRVEQKSTYKEVLEDKSARGEVIRMRLAGADTRATMSAQQPLKGYVNYMTGADRSKWKLGVPTFGQARISAVYPGIDLIYYGTEREMEYDFVVAPNADLKPLRLAIDGAHPFLQGNGELRLQTAAQKSDSDVVFKKPVIYQQIDGKRAPVDGGFTLAANGEVSFLVGTYDHSRELIIDPIISYASYFGGTLEDEINGTTINSANQLYAVGQTRSYDLPVSAGEFQATNLVNKNNNYHSAFVTKFSADGSTVLWTTYLAGSQDDFANSVAVGAADQPYIVGGTSSCGADNSIPGVAPNSAVRFPFTADALQSLCNPQVIGFNNFESNGGNYDAFLAHLSSDGKTMLYATPLGGSASDFGSSVVLDAAGKVYIVGETLSTQYFKCRTVDQHCEDIPAYPVNNHGNKNIGISNYPTTSGALYSNTTESSMNATTDPNNGNVSGPQDEQAFLTVLSADLQTITYSSLIGGPILGNAGNGTSATNGYALAVNTNGISFIGGNTSSAHWPVTAGAFAPTCTNAGQPNSTCNLTGWVAAFDPTKSGAASLLFTTYINGTSGGTAAGGTSTVNPGSDVFGLATDSLGNAIVTGDTSAVNFPTTPGTFQPACFKFNDGNGNTGVCDREAFLTKLTPSGSTVWSTYFGPTSATGNGLTGQGLAVDANNNVFALMLGGTPSLPQVNSLSANPGQNTDAFLAEFTPDASKQLLGTFLGSGGGISVNTNSLHLDSNLNAYFGGSQGYNPYGGTFLPVTTNAPGKTLQGSADGLVVKVITQQQASATALTVSPNPATPAQTITLAATVTTPSTLTGTILPTGAVTFLNGTTVIGTGALNASGIATYAGTLTGGAYTITASYAGDAGFNSSVSTATSLTVSSAVATTTNVTVAPTNSTYGTANVFTATVKAGAAVATTGSVSFTASSVTFGTASVNAQGVATLTTTPPVGTYSVIASYAGTYNATSNSNGYGPSLSTGAPFTVTKASSTTVLTSSASSVGIAIPFTLTATVTSGATSTVTFYNGTASLGTGLVTGGIATLTTSFTTAGTYNLTAVYGGDSNFTGSTSAALTETIVVPGFTATASPTTQTIARGSTGTATLTITPQGGYIGTIAQSCGALPSNATCSFTPATVILAGTAVTDVLTIGTGSATAMLSTPHRFHEGNFSVYSAFAFGMPGSLLALVGLSRRKNLRLRQLSLFGALCFISLSVMTGCGSSASSLANATPAGTYTIQVTLSVAGATPQAVPLTVIVQ